MASPSVTWTFTNGTTADATQVNTNFTDLINGLSDGTRDISVGTLTVAGASNFNGTVTLGNATADDITITGNIAASITLKANATYNFGSSTVGLLSVYLGNGSFTTRLLAGTNSASYTFTFPPASPVVTGKGLIFDANGLAEFRYPEKFTATKNSTYTATGDETIIPVDTSGGNVTMNLPAAASYAGKRLTYIKTTSDFNICTIDANASETINGALTTTVATQYETLTIGCDGTGWYIISRKTSNVSVLYSATFSAGFGTIGSQSVWWQRLGQFLRVYGNVTWGTIATSAASISLPGGTIDSSFLSVTTNTVGTGAGQSVGYMQANNANERGAIVTAAGTSTSLVYLGNIISGANPLIANSSISTSSWGNTRTASFEFVVPMTSWAAA